MKTLVHMNEIDGCAVRELLIACIDLLTGVLSQNYYAKQTMTPNPIWDQQWPYGQTT